MQKLLALTVVFSLGCSQQFTAVPASLEKVVNELGCPEMKNRIFEVYQNELQERQQEPTFDVVQLGKYDITSKNQEVDQAIVNYLNKISEFLKSYSEISDKIEALTALEFGSKTDAHLTNWQKIMAQQDSELSEALKSANISCSNTEALKKIDEVANRLAPIPRDVASLVVQGSRLTLATSYQSCDLLRGKPLDSSVEDLRGIEVYGDYDSVGKLRRISNLAALQESHPYFQQASYPSSCINVQKNPLIYDYGGRPLATTSGPQEFDLFKNQPGARTVALGIDCSAYIFVGLSTAGLRLTKGKDVLARQVYGITSHALTDPQDNGLTCLAATRFGKTTNGDLKRGDIVSIPGHVVFIDQVGSDPLGITAAANSNTCSQITSNQFNFVVSQSSPSKNAIGLHRHVAKDYLATSKSMKEGFEDIARKACKALRSGSSVVARAANRLTVVRHLGTPECISSSRVALRSEACVRSCVQ